MYKKNYFTINTDISSRKLQFVENVWISLTKCIYYFLTIHFNNIAICPNYLFVIASKTNGLSFLHIVRVFQ